MENYLIIIILLIIVALAAGYIIKSKKNGKKCIGCPYCSECSKKGGNSSCGGCNSEHK